jgi:hypothetical protein
MNDVATPGSSIGTTSSTRSSNPASRTSRALVSASNPEKNMSTPSHFSVRSGPPIVLSEARKRPPGFSHPRTLPNSSRWIARHVHDRVEGSDRVESVGREVQLGEVGLDERDFGSRRPREPKLLWGDVDPYDLEALGKTTSLCSVAASEVEHSSAVVDPLVQFGEVPLPRIPFDARIPPTERRSEDVVGNPDRPRVRGDRHRFSQTERCLRLSAVNGSRAQPLQRSRSRMPASRAIKSSSAGDTERKGIDRSSHRPSTREK